MTDDPTASAGGGTARVIQKDAPWVRFILFGLGLVFATIALLIVWNLGWRKWPDSAAHDLIDALKWAALLAIAGLVLMTAAFASPWLGTVRVAAGPVEISGRGRA